MEEKKVSVEMTEEQLAEFQEMQAKKKAEQEAQQRISLSEQLSSVKAKVYENWHSILNLKAEMLMKNEGLDMQNISHTFTHSNGRYRLLLGFNLIDNYNDLAEDGIQMVKEYISSLASDENSQMLVSAILDLLAKDKNGTLKASRVLKLDQMAEESGSDKFKEGVRIIKEAYNPISSKQFVRAYIKGEKNEWIPVPLSVTDAQDLGSINNQKEEDNE